MPAAPLSKALWRSFKGEPGPDVRETVPSAMLVFSSRDVLRAAVQ